MDDNFTPPKDVQKTFYPERVFVNHVDSYNAKALIQILADNYFGGNEEVGNEELNEEVEGEEPFKDLIKPPEKVKYQIYGTAKDPRYVETEDITYILRECDNFEEEILKCGFIVWDITGDKDEIDKASSILQLIDNYLEKIKAETPKKYEIFDEKRVFILISTVMTWAFTKPVDPDDPDVPFVETDYKKRKCHPNYKEHLALEKEVMKFGKNHKKLLSTQIIATGIPYGLGEDNLHFLFKSAWMNAPELPIIHPGNNTIPLIHIKDLINVIIALIKAAPKKSKYILAVEQTPSKQKTIVKTISKVLGTGKTKIVNKTEAFLIKELTQEYFDIMTVNLQMEPNYILELGAGFQSDLNFCENIDKIVKEYKQTRKLFPIKILMHGPPAVGKTSIAKELATFYNIHYISVKTLIEDEINRLNADLEYARKEMKLKQEKEEEEAAENEDDDEEEDDDDDEDLENVIADLTEKLKEIQGKIEESENGRLTDEQVVEIMKQKLASNPNQNQGFVLDGYPKTAEQTKLLFKLEDEEGDEEEEAEEEEEGAERDLNIIPQYVIGLEASDEFLCTRIMRKPQREVQGTHYEEERMAQRLSEFRKNNTEDNTLLNVFDFKEIHPIMINAETDIQERIIKIITDKIGPKLGYSKTREELEEERRLNELEQMERDALDKKQREELEDRMLEERQTLMETWIDMTNEVQEQEEQMLVAQNKPMRQYLMQFVFPTLTKGLVQVSKIKPDDPIDFLAEYLFTQNPEGRMFDPGYVKEGEDLINTIREYQHKVKRYLNVDLIDPCNI